MGSNVHIRVHVVYFTENGGCDGSPAEDRTAPDAGRDPRLLPHQRRRGRADPLAGDPAAVGRGEERGGGADRGLLRAVGARDRRALQPGGRRIHARRAARESGRGAAAGGSAAAGAHGRRGAAAGGGRRLERSQGGGLDGAAAGAEGARATGVGLPAAPRLHASAAEAEAPGGGPWSPGELSGGGRGGRRV